LPRAGGGGRSWPVHRALDRRRARCGNHDRLGSRERDAGHRDLFADSQRPRHIREHTDMRATQWITTLVTISTVASAAGAQTAGDSARLTRPLFVPSDVYVLGMFAVTTVAMFPLDRHLASVIRDEDLVTNKNLMRASSMFRFFGGSGPYLIGGSMYVVGRVSKTKRLAELGLHGTEAVVVGQGVASTLKLILGRARPYTSSDTNAHSFGFLRGRRGTDFQSFPSGHSTTAFAAAAAVQAETTEWWPESKWIIGPIVYSGAALVGLSRIYDDKHWASDVVMGAAIGTFAGLKVVRFNHTHEGNRIDRLLLGGKESGARLRLIGDGSSVGVVAHFEW